MDRCYRQPWAASSLLRLCTLFLLACLTSAGCVAPEGARHAEGLRRTDDLSALLMKARKSGSVKIIVHLRVSGMPDDVAAASGERDPHAFSDRDKDLEARIAAVADIVLRGLDGTRHRLYRRYASLPLIAIEASPEAIEALASMPEVADIREDVARPLK